MRPKDCATNTRRRPAVGDAADANAAAVPVATGLSAAVDLMLTDAERGQLAHRKRTAHSQLAQRGRPAQTARDVAVGPRPGWAPPAKTSPLAAAGHYRGGHQRD